MNTIQNNNSSNALIAEFMGYKKSISNTWFKGNKIMQTTSFKYHKDWNWLMEVVDKIYEMDLYYDKYIDYNSSMISNGKITLGTRINKVYEQVIDFIKWYNEQNK